MKKMIKSFADLATYLDKKGHRDESHIIDHFLHSVAQDAPPSWWSPIDRVRWEIDRAGDDIEEGDTSIEDRKMLQDMKEEPVHKEPETTQMPGEDKPVHQKFVVIEMTGFEPIRITKVSQAIKLAQHPKVGEDVVVKAIYNSIRPDSGEAMVSSGKKLPDAIKSALNSKVLEDDRWFWER